MTIIVAHRNRETGTTILLLDRRGEEAFEPWETICDDHGFVCSHETRKLAERWMAEPSMWCEACQRIASGNPRLIDKVS